MSNKPHYWPGIRTKRGARGIRPAVSIFLIAAIVLLTTYWASPTTFAIPPGGGLAAVGPVDPQTTFPAWYSDANGVSLKLCIGDPLLCISAPVDPGNPLSVQTGFGDEGFWWAADASMNVGSGGSALLVLAVEAAYSTGDVAPGAQMSFGRIRVRASGVQPGATYTVTHPFGTETLVADSLGNLRMTDDLGCLGVIPGLVPCDWGLALVSRVGPFLVWDPAVPPAPPAGFVGDAATPHKVIGGVLGTNFFRIEGPNVGGPGSNVAQTDLFVVQGQKFLDAVDDNARVPQNAQRRPINVLANDANATSVIAVTPPVSGVTEVGAGGANALFTAQSGFSGVATFTYTASNGPLNDTATVNVTVHAANTAPVALNENLTVAINSTANVVNVLANDSDPDGDIINVTAATKGANSQDVLVDAFGANITYTPKAGFSGLDSFTYTLNDGALTAIGTVNVTVDRPPAAANDTATVTMDSASNSINVLANDSDPDANPIAVTAVTQGLHGTVTLSPGGAGVLYTPSAGFAGSDSFTYTISDGFLTATATVNVTVDRVPSLVVTAPAFGGPAFIVSWSVPGTWTGPTPASYDVQFRDGLTGLWTDLLSSTPALSTTFTGGQDGHTYYFQVRARTTTGAVGGWSGPVSTAVDMNAPSGSVSVNGGANYASSLAVTLALLATDSLTGVSEMSFSNDGTTWSDWQGYGLTKAWNLAPGADGPRTAYARFRDLAQSISAVSSDTIIVDTAPPTGTITVTGGALATNSTAVTLTVSAADAGSGVSQMSLSNDGLNYSPWEDYATTKLWTIPGGNGTKTVYARFKDGAGNLSAPVSVAISLSTLLPSSAVAPLSPYQKTAGFTVSWSGSAGAGVDSFDIQYRDGASGAWTDWQLATTATSAVFTGVDAHTYYFQSRVRDQNNNLEAYVGADGHTQTTVDLTPPTGSISINAGALDTPAITVTLALSVTDSLSGVPEASYSNDGSLWSAWEGMALAKAWSLLIGDGEKTAWARFRDGAGNVSAPVSDTIRLDTTVTPAHGLSINDGAIFTNQVTVTLSLQANPGTAQVMLSNDGGFSSAVWEPYSAYKSWTVTQYGSLVIPRLVYVKYRDIIGNVSGVYQDDIVLDLTAPTGSVQVQGSPIGGAVVRVAGTNVTLRLSAADDVSGVSGMMVSNSPAFTGAAWETLTATKSWSIDSGGKVYVAFKDYAGNVSPTYTQSSAGTLESLPAMASAVLHPRTGGILSAADGKTVISFPGGAVNDVAEVTLVPAVDSTHRAGIGALRSSGKFLSLSARTATGSVTTFARPYTLTVTYAPSEIGGIVESSLGIYWWNGRAWQKEPSSRVDTASRTVSASLDHMSSFAVLGESSIRGIYLPLLARAALAAW